MGSVYQGFRIIECPNLLHSGLGRLRDGQVQSISCCIGENHYVLEKEKEWPIQSWRVGDRIDGAARAEIVYWVRRGNGYSKDGYEEEVHFTIVQAGDRWELKSFSAIY